MMMLLCPYALATGFGGVGLGLGSQLPRLRRVRAELAASRWAAEHDPLTGLPNRAGLRQRFDENRAAGLRDAVVLLDLDGFKAVNDTWGHQTGDALLAAMATRLSEACPPGAFAGRLAGDEFVVLLPESSGELALTTVAAILAHVGQPMAAAEGLHCGMPVSLAASAGIAAPSAQASWSA